VGRTDKRGEWREEEKRDKSKTTDERKIDIERKKRRKRKGEMRLSLPSVCITKIF
jgi:hypothetical protein